MDTLTKAANLWGLAKRAGRAVSGNFAVEKAVQKGQAVHITIAKDAAAETKKKYEQLAAKNNIAFSYLFTMEELGHALGQDYRAAAAITDAGFGRSFAHLLIAPTAKLNDTAQETDNELKR